MSPRTHDQNGNRTTEAIHLPPSLIEERPETSEKFQLRDNLWLLRRSTSRPTTDAILRSDAQNNKFDEDKGQECFGYMSSILIRSPEVHSTQSYKIQTILCQIILKLAELCSYSYIFASIW